MLDGLTLISMAQKELRAELDVKKCLDLAHVEVEAKNYDKALEYLNRASEINPYYHHVWRRRGALLEIMSEDKLSGAVAYYDKAIKTFGMDKSGDSDLMKSMNFLDKGRALYHLHKLEDALECLDSAVKINPDNAKAWMYKGITLYKMWGNASMFGGKDKRDKARYKREAHKCFKKADDLFGKM